MSDVSSSRHLRPARCQLPVAWYFDPEVFAREKQLLFAAGANYVGHELMVPNVGDYHTLAWQDHAKVLVRNAGGVELLSNVCRHRQSIMLEGRGNTGNIVCPLHRWTYDLKGELLGAPHFPENPCVKLHSTPLTNWRGLLFAGPADPRQALAGMTTIGDWDFSGYVLDRVMVDEYEFNWKTFIEVYLEVYHVNPFHPGLGNFTDCDNFTVDYGADWSVQIVQAKAGLGKPGTPVYRKWHEACLQHLDGRVPRQGALWMTWFPGLMMEWYPNVLVVSHLIPRSPTRTTNVVEFYYPEEIALFEREFVEAQQAAYVETAKEDDEICLRMDRGRRALWEEGRDDAGPYQSPMEDTMVHFHEWVRRKLAC
ncbi:MAG: aromatic ring-hydroxylating dioxygenase subunit alpha [Betaproteobacteria bacterium]|nr:aromatic ring-hydroxylating dioxygenase subunit alpha [Betaproteobacteria bacterium]MDH5219989.1 aromatic ring-hydroxylating dioxygenase subunit alpha [Betaproteobacteria bacterium]MDH5350661.1 aromatic ring-hydroxylating dioxygenase subunit alpha [Betaproteobacteria bacterium]